MTYGYGGRKKILTGYCNKKKVFELYENVIGFDLLYRQLCFMGKIERGQLKEEFTVRETNGNIARDVFSVMLFGGERRGTDALLLYCFCSSYIVLSDRADWYFIVESYSGL